MSKSQRTATPLLVFIENEAGSRLKNTFDERTLALLRSETVSAPYPFAYGFVPGTRAGDGDAVDCFVLTAKPLRPGERIDCEPVGLLEQIEDGETDHKILAVPAGTVPPCPAEAAAAEIRRFVTAVFAHVPGKRVSPGRLLGPADALDYLRRAGAS